MKLKTRLKLAWLELALAGLFLALAIILKLSMSPIKTPIGVVLDVAVAALLTLPLCVAAWRRLGRVRTQIAEKGPEEAPSDDLWSAPGAPGVVSAMILLLALAVALGPPILLH